MKQKQRMAVISALIIAGMGGIYAYLYAAGYVFQFGNPAVFDVELSPNGEFLYIAQAADNEIIKVRTLDMTRVDSYNVTHPTCLSLTNDGSYLFSNTYGDPGGISCINVSTGVVEHIVLDGSIPDFAIDASHERIWAIGQLWPQEGDDTNQLPPPDTGVLTEISYDGPMAVISSTRIDSVPNSIYYSSVSNRLYIKHNLINWVLSGGGAYQDEYDVDGQEQVITVYDAGSLAKLTSIYGGADLWFDSYSDLGAWDSTGRYLTIPAQTAPTPAYSLKVIDTLDNSTTLDMTIPYNEGWAMSLQYAHLVPGQNVIWATVSRGEVSQIDQRRLVVRINTSTLDYDVFPVDTATDKLGDFAVSPDGSTLYLPILSTGEIIVWQTPDY